VLGPIRVSHHHPYVEARSPPATPGQETVDAAGLAAVETTYAAVDDATGASQKVPCTSPTGRSPRAVRAYPFTAS
jgi:hypothetical protein